jgi:hypothetical protein
MKCATPGAVIPLAQVQPVTFSHLLRAYGKRAAKPPRLLPAPWQPAWMVLRCLELGGVRLSFRSDSLLSLVNQNPDPDFSATHGLGLALRTFPGEETPRQWGVET